MIQGLDPTHGGYDRPVVVPCHHVVHAHTQRLCCSVCGQCHSILPAHFRHRQRGTGVYRCLQRIRLYGDRTLHRDIAIHPVADIAPVTETNQSPEQQMSHTIALRCLNDRSKIAPPQPIR